MEKFIILGDVHGDLGHCKRIARKNGDRTVIQIGDCGVGSGLSSAFGFVEPHQFLSLPNNFKFFCGNHDNRSEARKIPSCLGDYGEFKGLFFISGADSFDKEVRIPNVEWWADEELTYAQGRKAVDQWAASKSEIMLSHDVPQSIAEKYLLIYDRSLTRDILQAALEARRPKLWIAGHHHRTLDLNEDGMRFKILDSNHHFPIDISN